MSEWTLERHAAARRAIEQLEDGREWGDEAVTLMRFLPGALDEIERQRAQAALRKIPSPFTLKKMADAASREMFQLEMGKSPTMSQFLRGTAVTMRALTVWLKEGTK